jgi:nuclear cap-binding protein subunit 1
VVLGKILQLPNPERKLVYYGVVLMEMCKIQPDTFPIVFGRAVSFLFSRLDSMDVGCFYRFCDMFAHHLSNFGFYWNWNDW